MKRLLALCLSICLVGCGGEPFHLRQTKPLPVIAEQGVYVQGIDARSDFGRALMAGLEDAGANIKPRMDEAGLLLDIKGVRENKSGSGYSSTRQVREFNHWLDVDFAVKSKTLPQPVERSVHAERSQVYDGKYVLGTAEEEALIKEELRNEAVRLMLLRLQAL